MALSAKTPGDSQKRVVIPNKHGEKLVGILHDSGAKEIVILCHGFRSSKESNTIVNLAAALEKAGISSFRFDFSGNGESDGLFQYGYYRREADDLHSVTQHFRGLNRLVTAIVGHSKGAGVVLLYASKYNDVKAVVNISGRYDLKAGIEERLGKDYMERIKEDGFIDVKGPGSSGYRVTLESLLDRLDTNMHEACLHIDTECRVLTVHGSSDTVISVEDAYQFAQILPNHTLHIEYLGLALPSHLKLLPDTDIYRGYVDVLHHFLMKLVAKLCSGPAIIDFMILKSFYGASPKIMEIVWHPLPLNWLKCDTNGSTANNASTTEEPDDNGDRASASRNQDGQLPITQEQYATLVNLLQQSNIQQGSSTATSNQVYSSTVTGNFLPEDDWFS
ncbi:unnamed protein product [Vicia faba]|uniref:Serine aminopeptidase S33 domain-containing protein n=1 Tax=Vicia faba TaxID=3906 RepID=A0AAV1B398_VICFA|nr:unnamed protein product [Vicia faba]